MASMIRGQRASVRRRGDVRGGARASRGNVLRKSSSRVGEKAVKRDEEVLERLSTLYGVSALIAGGGCVAQTGFASWLTEKIFNAGDAAVPALVQVSQLRNDVSFVPLVCAMLWSMKQASDKGNVLSSATYTSLNVGVALYATIGLGTAAVFGGFNGDQSLLGYIKLATLAPAGLASFLALTAQDGGVGDALSTAGKDLRTSFFDVRRDSKISLYFISQLWITIVVGGSFLLSPTSPVANPPELGGETATLALIRHCFGTNGAVLRDTERQRQRQTLRLCVCVCIYIYTYVEVS